MGEIKHRKQARRQDQGATVDKSRATGPTSLMDWLRRQPVWIVLAVASGTCAAINGVFAKLTTTSLTSTFAASLASFLGLAEDNTYVNLALRGTCFGLNIVFNIAMWALFTAALTRGSSTTRVSIINVSSNFFITALLGAMIFGEKLPLGWWAGAALLAAGNVVIGRREEGDKPGGTIGLDESRQQAEQAENLLSGDHEEDLLELHDNSPSSKKASQRVLQPHEDPDDPI